MTDRYEFIPLGDLQKPKDYHIVVCGHYWILDDQDRAMLFTMGGSYSPQCNIQRKTAKMILRKLKDHGPHHRVVWVRHAYLPAERYS